MGTDVTYNGVKLKNVLTRQWEQEAVYDASGTDLMFFRHRMRFEGIVHNQSADANWDSVPAGIFLEGGNPSATTIASSSREDKGAFTEASIPHNVLSVTGQSTTDYPEIRRRLGIPRETLVVSINDNAVLTCGAPGTANGDLDNGPKPKEVSIVAIASDKVLKVAFSIECAVSACSGARYAVLSNRWAVIESMDENFFTTRTIRGKIRFDKTVVANREDFKYLVVPGLERGFRRERVEYSVAETGIEADYQILDRQTHTAAPWPATRLSGSYVESCGEQGIEWFSDVQIRLDGHPGADRKLLIQRAVQVMDARLKFLDEAQKNGKRKAIILEGAQLTEHIGDANAVELHVRLRRTLQEADQHSWLGQLRTQTMGQQLTLKSVSGEPYPYEANRSQPPQLYGYVPQVTNRARSATVLFLMQCFLQDPCTPPISHMITHGDAGGGPPTTTPEDKPTPVEVSPGDIENSLDTDLSDDAKTTVYTLGVAESIYYINQMRVQLPLAGDDSDPDADTSFVAVLSGGQCQREIRYEAEKVGELPQIPKPLSTYTDGGLKGTLLKHRLRFHPPTLISGGKDKVFRVHAYYLYAMNRPPKDDEKLRSIALPTQKYTITEWPMDLSTTYSEAIGP